MKLVLFKDHKLGSKRQEKQIKLLQRNVKAKRNPEIQASLEHRDYCLHWKYFRN